MKRFFITICLVIVSVCTFAQKGEKTIGVNLSYGSEIKNIGIGVKGQYLFTDHIRGEASFDYFLKKYGLTMWDINANIHYLFNVGEKVKIYPLAGVGYVNFSGGVEYDYDYDYYTRAYDDEGSSSISRIAINLGGGVQYGLTERININAEVKYQIIENFNQIVPSIGVAFKF